MSPCNRLGHYVNNNEVGLWNQGGSHGVIVPGAILAGMVTHIHKHAKRRLFLKEHRKAKGVSATAMAGRLGIERESVYRLEREQWRMDPEKQAEWAAALGIEPEDLWRLPGRPSLDGMIQAEPDDVKDMAADIVKRLVKRRS
jgi:DNA-binding XRE family transcriptional regulator